MIRMRTLLLPLLLVSVVGCAAKAEAPAVVNANCPMMGDPVEAEGGTYDWDGKSIGFCCGGCSGKFEALDDTAKQAKLDEANPK